MCLRATTAATPLRCPMSSTRKLLGRSAWRRTPGRDTAQHAFQANVLVNVGPVNSLTVPNDFPACSLLRSRIGEAPRPAERHTHNSAVGKADDYGFVGNVDGHDARISLGCSAHPKPF